MQSNAVMTRALLASLFAGGAIFAPIHVAPVAAQDEGNTVEVAPQESRVVTLDEVLALAGSISPTVVLAEYELEEMSYRRLEAQLAWLPRVRASMTVAPAPADVSEGDTELDQFGSIFEGASYAMRGSMDASLPLYTFGKIRLARQLANVGMDVEEAELQQAILSAQFEAYRAYVVLQWYEEIDELLREAGGRLDDAEEALEIALDDGDRSARTSLRQLTIYRADFVESRTEADQVARLARFALTSALNLPEGFEVEPLDTELEDTRTDEAATLDFALEHRQDFRLLEANVDAAELRVDIARADMAPDIYAALGISGRRAPSYEDLNGPFVYDPYNSFGLGVIVGLRWDFNIGREVARSMWREAQVATAEHEREGGRMLIELDVVEAYGEANGAFQILEAHTAGRRAATAWLTQVSFQYDQGLADFDEFVDPLRAYYAVSGDYFEALLQYRLDVANLAVQTGSSALSEWPGQADDSPETE